MIILLYIIKNILYIINKYKYKNNKYYIYIKENDKEERHELSKQDFIKFLKSKSPRLDFIINYIQKK